MRGLSWQFLWAVLVIGAILPSQSVVATCGDWLSTHAMPLATPTAKVASSRHEGSRTSNAIPRSSIGSLMDRPAATPGEIPYRHHRPCHGPMCGGQPVEAPIAAPWLVTSVNHEVIWHRLGFPECTTEDGPRLLAACEAPIDLAQGFLWAILRPPRA